MKKLAVLACFWSAYSYAQPQTISVTHVVLISIDGFRPEMYLDKSWPTPNLQLLMQQGTYAQFMKSVFPSYTYPSHTAMLTGALPARSGIYYNQPKNSHGDWNWFTNAIKTPTLWQVFKKAGMTTSAIEWPVSVDSNITYNIPEIWSNDAPGDRITEVRKYATPGLIEEIERNATGKLDSNSMNEDYFSLDENSGRMAAYIFKTRKPNFLALHFACVDGEEHEFGREGDSVRLAVGSADRAIGDIMEAIQRSGLADSTAILIVGDHGFCDLQAVFRPNLLLQNVAARFTAAGGSAFLYLTGTPPVDSRLGAASAQNIIREVHRRLDSLPEDQRKTFRIIDRNELDAMGADSSAVLALAAVPGLVFSGASAPARPVNMGPGTTLTGTGASETGALPLFSSVKGGHHGYDPDLPDMHTGFIAAGAGIRKKGNIPSLCVTDVAPLVALLLGVSFTCPDGKVIAGILKN